MTDFNKLDNQQLELAWQAQCQIIQRALTEYYKTSNESFREIAESAQNTQSKIQKEITRRGP